MYYVSICLSTTYVIYISFYHISTYLSIYIALFRTEFSGRGELSERQQKLGQHLGQLVRIAEEFNIAVFVINQCMADPGAMSMFG